MDATAQFGFCYAVITFFCLLFGSVVASKVNHDIGSEREVRFFRFMVYSYLGFTATELVWCIGNFKLAALPVSLLSLMSMLSMVSLALICYFWFCYGETKLGNNLAEKPRIMALSSIPILAVIVLYVTSPLTGLMYSYSADGTFVQGPAYSLAIPLEDVYILVVTVHAIVRFVREKSASRRNDYLTLVAFPILPTLAGAFDSIVPAMPVISPALFASIFFVFIQLQDSQIFNDALTGLNNRRRADQYLEEAISQATSEQPVFLFMIDVNDFKLINDTYGHFEGDRALRIVAEGIKRTCIDLRAFAARWGGDEFMIVGQEQFIGSAGDLIDRLRSCIEEARVAEGVDYRLSVSVGFSRCTGPHDTKGQMERAADDMLYEQKALLRPQAKATAVGAA